MEMLGHSTPNMIRNVYGHIMSEKETAIKKQVSDAFAFLS
jgi:integrase